MNEKIIEAATPDIKEGKFTSAVHALLVEEVKSLPPNAVERTKKEDTRKGYDTTGYQYQFLVNVMNEVLGPNGWGFAYRLIHETTGAYRSGQEFHELTVETTVRVLDAERTCVGGHVSTSYSDALKGAMTNSLKKTVALFGVGKESYEGTLDDDFKPLPDEPKNVVAAKTSAKTRNALKLIQQQTNPSVLAEWREKVIADDYADADRAQVLAAIDARLASLNA